MTLYLQQGRGLGPVLAGSALGVAIVSATHGSAAQRTAEAMFVAAGFALPAC